ncbi:hypothetical protein TWF694_002560 [Orbilia ellipsospora]|uniref:DNL-type domain-containing protein n=1 Tax=Orbilia ellipsospora TaxID=2528407 RepID=A0AAV9X2G3_9PEZI
MRASTSRLARSLTRLSSPSSSRILPPRPITTIYHPSISLSPSSSSRIPPPFSSFIRKYSSESDSPSILPPPSSSSPSSPSSSSPSSQKVASFPLSEKPSYELTFTCKKCSHRSSHKVSKQAYHKGTVLIQCPNPTCQVRHLIADHLKIFRDNPTTIEDILKQQGEKITKGVKYSDGDIEILPDEEVVEGEVKNEGEKEK